MAKQAVSCLPRRTRGSVACSRLSDLHPRQAAGAPGYTLIEVLLAVAILATLAAAAAPLVAPVTENNLDAAAQEVAGALRFARGEAMRTGGIHGVDFSVDVATGRRRIRVFRSDGAVPPNPVFDVRHPLDKKPYDIQLAASPGTQGVIVSSAAFRYLASPSTVVVTDWAAFLASGMPDYYPDAAAYSLVPDATSPAQVTVSLGGRSRSIEVNPSTGRVTVQ